MKLNQFPELLKVAQDAAEMNVRTQYALKCKLQKFLGIAKVELGKDEPDDVKIDEGIEDMV